MSALEELDVQLKTKIALGADDGIIESPSNQRLHCDSILAKRIKEQEDGVELLVFEKTGVPMSGAVIEDDAARETNDEDILRFMQTIFRPRDVVPEHFANGGSQMRGDTKHSRTANPRRDVVVPGTTRTHPYGAVWTKELHGTFVRAVNVLGGAYKATPKAVLHLMNIPGLQRSAVSSYLQKYRRKLREMAMDAHFAVQ